MGRKRLWVYVTFASVVPAAALSVTLAMAAPVPQSAAATLTVTKTGDTSDGVCDADCSLREAMAAASPGDTIVIPTGTYTLTQKVQLTINKSLTLKGSGSEDTVIQAAIRPGGANFRVLSVLAGNNVRISGVTVRNGKVGVGGGGIHNAGFLTLTSSVISGNSAADGWGGGIYNEGILTLTSSVISGNSAADGWGGGIYNAGALTLTSSTVSGNSANKGWGGGVYNEKTLMLTNSTVSGNSAADGWGGGIYNQGALAMTNSTISGNSALDGWGGGIYNEGRLTLSSSTVSGNIATESGGGIFSEDQGKVNLSNTIIAVNTSLIRPDCRGLFTSQGRNLIGYADGCEVQTNTGDLVDLDPLLGPLQDNGGPTKTHALLPGSPAIDRIPAEACTPQNWNSTVTDQRGVARPQNGSCDVGAYELGPCGDATDDGVVGIADVIISLQTAVGLVMPTPTQTILSDLDRDGVVSVSDAIIGLQNIVGLIPLRRECGL
jgi:CSLREA domain-containing protein